MEIHFSSITNSGAREINEDSFRCERCGERACFCLADGLGGHGRGDEASQIAVETTLQLFKHTEEKPQELLRLFFERGQQKILEKQEENNCSGAMKTTQVILLITKNSAVYGHIGDSRLYFFRKGALNCRTLDHSVPQMLVATGEIKEWEIRHHEDRNRLLRVMGTEWNDPRYELVKAPLRLKRGDAFLLCSDGFWEWITETEMLTLLREKNSVEEWLTAMSKTVVCAGAGHRMDNYTAIAVWIE